VVGEVPNYVDVIEPSVGSGMRDPNLEFGVDPVEEEDRACGLRDWQRRNSSALMVRWVRVLQ
jgi:hypothetical protein